MNNEPRMLSLDEMDALDGTTVRVLGTGTDAFAFQTEDERTYIVTLCLGCGSHVGYYEVDPSVLVTSGDDLAAAG